MSILSVRHFNWYLQGVWGTIYAMKGNGVGGEVGVGAETVDKFVFQSLFLEQS